MQTVMGVAVFSAIATSLLNMKSPTALWSLTHQIQLFMLLLLTKRFIPDDVKYMLVENSFIQFDLSFIPFNKIAVISNLLDMLDIDQDNVYLKMIDVTSGSGINNVIGILISIFILLVVHGIIAVTPKFTPKPEDEHEKCKQVFNLVVTSLRSLFTFTIYIRTLYEGFQFLLLSSFPELIKAEFSDSKLIISYSISSVVFVTLALFVILSFYMFYTTRNNFFVEEKLK